MNSNDENSESGQNPIENNWTDWTDKKEEKFLKSLVATGGNVSRACRLVQIARSTAYHRKENDKEFGKKWKEAVEKGVDDLEQEARRRAVKGVDEPVFYKGVIVGHIRSYSDSLLMFLLKGNRPEKYKERHELTGKDGGAIKTDNKLTIEIVDSANEPQDK